MDIAVKKTDIGVMVGRFQVDDLHDGHNNLIDTVMAAHDKVVLFLGIHPAINTPENPLEYKHRELMLKQVYPSLTILPIKDVHNDEEWSKILDTKIREVHPMGSVTLYGSRDGFIPHYSGAFPTVELQASFKISGSEIRKSLSTKIIASKDFRQGMIYAAFSRYPISYTTVDAAILDGKGNILLARKKVDPKNKWRFIGGFVDVNQDANLEEAVKREVMEETNSLGVGEPKYIGSAKIDDWRYKGKDGIMTSLFVIPYLFGKPEATDDIDDLQWFSIQKLIDNEGFQMVEEHKVLFNLLKKHLEIK